MSPARELWKAIFDRLSSDAGVLALVDGIHDKEPAGAWAGVKAAFITRGPAYGVDESAECVDGAELTQQIDIWSRSTRRSACDDIVYAVRRSLHDAELALNQHALVSIRVTLWRTVDDPDPLTQHGVVMVTALVEEH